MSGRHTCCWWGDMGTDMGPHMGTDMGADTGKNQLLKYVWKMRTWAVMTTGIVSTGAVLTVSDSRDVESDT